MTEKKWLQAFEPYDLITSAFLHKSWTHPRAPRLLACAVCRLVWDQIEDRRSRNAIEVAEQFADGKATLKALTAAHREARTAYQETRPRAPDRWLFSTAAEAARTKNIMSAMESVVMTISGSDEDAFHALVMSMIHDVFDRRLFRPPTFDSSWRTSTVLSLANGIYQEKAFDRLPILADALMEAGCEDADILNHCRATQLHIRGCWALDLALGRDEM